MHNSSKHHPNKAVHANLLIPVILSIFFLFLAPIMNILPAQVARAASPELPPETRDENHILDWADDFTLDSPANGAINVDTRPTFSWGEGGPFVVFELNVATSLGTAYHPLQPRVIDKDNIIGHSWTVPANLELDYGTTYYWNVTAIYWPDILTTNDPVITTSEIWSFTTEDPNNLPPTDITLSHNDIAENTPANLTIGGIYTTDPNEGDTFTYSLVSSNDYPDNASFNIVSNNLRSLAVLDYEAKSTYYIRVRSTDQVGAYTEKTFAIFVTNVVEDTITTVSADPNPTDYGQDYTVSVTVTPVSGAGYPTGLVDVYDGTNTCCTNLTSGTGRCVLPATSAGSQTLTANYSGDSNWNASSGSTTVEINPDITAPTVTINQASAQADPTNASPIEFAVEFSESVTGFTADDVSLTGSTAPGAIAVVSGSGASYTVRVSGMTGSGLVIVSIPAAAAQDASGNTSEASTSTDNSVTYDVTSPTVTINQASGQVDPTNASPITFDVVFSESVTGFAAEDVAFTGSTTPGTLVAAVSGSDASYTVRVSGMTDSDLITVSIPAAAAQDASGNTSEASTSTDNEVLYDITSIALMQTGYKGFPGNTIMKDLGGYTTRFSKLMVTFDSDANNPAGDSEPDDVTNPANYLLVKPGPNQEFEITSCTIPHPGVSIPVVDDVIIPVGPVVYSNNGTAGPFEATLTVNNGTLLPYGKYRLIVCGSTSITDLAGNPLNGGIDPYITFTLIQTPEEIPATGFPVGEVTALTNQPVEKAYANTGITLRIPTLGLTTEIIGVPLTDSGWDISWLSNQVGYLEGSAFPTWAGNTVLTGHVWDANNLPGPFINLKNLKYGDLIEIEAWGQVYTYEVRSSSLICASDINTVMHSEVLDWLTLVTCESYDAQTQDYPYRRMVRAVLISVK